MNRFGGNKGQLWQFSWKKTAFLFHLEDQFVWVDTIGQEELRAQVVLHVWDLPDEGEQLGVNCLLVLFTLFGDWVLLQRGKTRWGRRVSTKQPPCEVKRQPKINKSLEHNTYSKSWQTHSHFALLMLIFLIHQYNFFFCKFMQVHVINCQRPPCFGFDMQSTNVVGAASLQ